MGWQDDAWDQPAAKHPPVVGGVDGRPKRATTEHASMDSMAANVIGDRIWSYRKRGTGIGAIMNADSIHECGCITFWVDYGTNSGTAYYRKACSTHRHYVRSCDLLVPAKPPVRKRKRPAA